MNILLWNSDLNWRQKPILALAAAVADTCCTCSSLCFVCLTSPDPQPLFEMHSNLTTVSFFQEKETAMSFRVTWLTKDKVGIPACPYERLQQRHSFFYNLSLWEVQQTCPLSYVPTNIIGKLGEICMWGNGKFLLLSSSCELLLTVQYLEESLEENFA